MSLTAADTGGGGPIVFVTPFNGYLGQVWRTAYNSLQWLSGIMASSGNSPYVVSNPAEIVYQTLRNAVDAVSAYAVAEAWRAEIVALQGIQILPITLSTATAAFFNARIAAYVAAEAALRNILPIADPSKAANQLALSVTAVPDMSLLEFYMTFDFEVPPTGISTSFNFLLAAQNAASAWSMVATAVSTLQGTTITQAYDTAIRQFECAQTAVNLMDAFVSGPLAGDPSGNWNVMVTAPALLADAMVLGSAPYSVANQQSGVIRYALISMLNSLEFLLVSLRQPATAVANLGTLYNNDTLLDFAARTTGNFANWRDVATANALQPPWTGPNGAPYGGQLQIPVPGSPPPTPGVAFPTYAANVLGTDIYIGPINGDMPKWTGDFQLVTGYSNLAISLGRRLQTTLGTLIYHNDFGSRIPPEVGNVQDNATAQHIAAFGVSALSSDPRVGNIISATATIVPNGLGEVNFNALVQPIGQAVTGVQVNEVISAPA